MPIEKKTQTITSKITPPFGCEFQIAATLPTTKPDSSKIQRVPISVHLSKVGTNTTLGCYVYSIVNQKNGMIHQTLLNNSEEVLVDMCKKIGRLISKKFNVPSYVSLSGFWSLEDLLTTVQSTVKFIEETYL